MPVDGAYLQKFRCFDDLSDEQREVIAKIAEAECFYPEHTLFEENEPGKYLYLMMEGEIDATRIPRGCLDVLAQQIVGAVASGDWNAGDLFALVRRSHPYSHLSREQFDEILGMLAGEHPFEMARAPRPLVLWDRAADRRVEENRALRRLFVQVAPEIDDPGLRARLEAASGEEEESLRISDLNRSNDRLRTLLIELHADVEEIDTEIARRIEAAIWEELRVSTERRALSLAPF